MDTFAGMEKTAEEKKWYDQYLQAAVDSSFADCIETYRSTSGFVVWFGGSPIEWECKRQPLVTLSTMESEYVAASKCVCSIRFLKKLIEFVELGKGTTKVHEDNAACVAVSSKPVHRSRSKHIGTKYHNVRDASSNGEVELVQVWTEHQCADLFTKSLVKEKFQRFREVLMGRVTFKEMQERVPKPEATVAMSNNTNYMSYYMYNSRAPTGKCPEYGVKYAAVSHHRGWNAYQVPKRQDFGKEFHEWRSCMLGNTGYDMPGYGARSI